MTARTVVYDSGMLAALLRGKPAAVVLHHALRAAAHRPIVARTASLDTYRRAGAMLGKALLSPKKRPDAVDALVVVTAVLHGPAQILTSDPEDISAYAATLDHADIITETI